MDRIRRIAAHLHPSQEAKLMGLATGEVAACSAAPVKRVVITGAAGQIGYSLVFNVAAGVYFCVWDRKDSCGRKTQG
jgi:hypothetical protein